MGGNSEGGGQQSQRQEEHHFFKTFLQNKTGRGKQKTRLNLKV